MNLVLPERETLAIVQHRSKVVQSLLMVLLLINRGCPFGLGWGSRLGCEWARLRLRVEDDGSRPSSLSHCSCTNMQEMDMIKKL